MKLESGKCSYYVNVKSKQNQVITLAQFVNAIRQGRWKKDVEDYRRCKAEKRLKEAEAIKARMPGVVSAGVCEGGHSKKNVRILSGYMMIDIDNYEGDIRQLVATLKAFPWVQAAWVSISGTGAKAEIRIDAETVEEYEKQAYPIVAQHLVKVLDTPLDMQCRDLSRFCYASSDSDAFYKEGLCEIFPWRERVDEFLKTQAENPKSSMKSGKIAISTPPGEAEKTEEGMVDAFLDHYLSTHSYVPHYRHPFLLNLGRAARERGMNPDEFGRLLDLAARRLDMPDCGPAEIRRVMTDAYHHFGLSDVRAKHAQGSRAHQVHVDPLNVPDTDGWTDPEDVKEHNKEVRRTAPLLPDRVYGALPEMVREALEGVEHPRQRDMLLLGVLTNLSACMPRVTMQYGYATMYTNLYFVGVASAASGKGILSMASRLLRGIEKYLEGENRKNFKEYRVALNKWEEERKRAMKEKRQPNFDLEPEEPPFRLISLQAMTSRSKIVMNLHDNPDGLIINVSELDAYTASSKADYGHFDDLLRACFQHETVGLDFKVSGRPFVCRHPRLSFCATCTPDQFPRLVPQVENGLMSRLLIYFGDREVTFISQQPTDAMKEMEERYDALSERVCRYYHRLLAYPTEVQFTDAQWTRHAEFFERMMERTKLEGGQEVASIVMRHAVMAARIAMIFTAIRKCEAEWDFPVLTCTDEDLEVAMEIVGVVVEHSLMQTTSMRNSQLSYQRMSRYFQVDSVLRTLKKPLAFTALVDKLMALGMSLSTAKRRIKMLLESNVLKKRKNKSGDIVYSLVDKKWLRKEDGHSPKV